MKQSLFRTRLAVAIAGVAVLVVAFLGMRDFVRDVFPSCPGALRVEVAPSARVDARRLERVPAFDTKPEPGGHVLRLVFDEKTTKGPAPTTTYDNVRLVRVEGERDGRECQCGSVRVPWRAGWYGASPSEIVVERDRETGVYYVSDASMISARGKRGTLEGSTALATFRVTGEPKRIFQPARIVSGRNLPLVVVTVAFGALAVALFRSRRAVSYATRLHAWKEATLTSQGRIENAEGVLLANADASLTSTYRRWPVPAGPILVAPSALESGGLYRDMPVASRRDVVEGTHARWAAATMVSLRDARALAVLSTMCTALAYAARAFGV